MKVLEVVQDIMDVDEENLNITELIRALKNGRTTELPDIAEFRKQYYPRYHDIYDKVKRPDRTVKDDDGNIEKMQEVNRISVPLQKTIVRTAVSFSLGNPIGLKTNEEDSKREGIIKALKRVFHDNKITSFNRVVGRELFRATETAEYWYKKPLKMANDHYGFSTNVKIKVQKFSPWDGDELYPYFDATGDLIAFSRGYCRKLSRDKSVDYFETYTDEEFIRWKKDGQTWEQDEKAVITLGKIPIVYASQEEPEWSDVQVAIDRLETLLSNHAEIIDYHADPKIFVSGEIETFLEKGKAGGILQGEQNAKAEYLSWEQSPEAVKLEIETLLRFIFSCTQTPDISFDSVKGLQQISGEALKMLFMDAHLKVQDKREVLDAYFQRRINICLAMLGEIGNMATETAAMMIEPEIKPYSIENLKEMIENLTNANGGKAIISQKTAVKKSGLVDDPDEEYEQIQKEQESDATLNIFEPSNA